MKRILTPVLLLMVVMVCAACNANNTEEFKLHSGVEFGMTTQEVRQAESENGFDAQENGGKLEVTGTIASIENSSITYSFDENGKLYMAAYYLPDHFSEGDFSPYLMADEMKDYWTDVSSILVEKYGVPECGNVAKKYYKLEPITDKVSTFSELIGDYSGRQVIFEQWLVQVGDGTSVLIENSFWVRTFTGVFGKGAHYIPRLQYFFCDKETTKALLAQNSSGGKDL